MFGQLRLALPRVYLLIGSSGKWHLGEGQEHEPSGFDEWEVFPSQGTYFDPLFVNSTGVHEEKGYATDIVTDKTIDFIKRNKPEQPFFVMCHHKVWPQHSTSCF